MEFKRKKIILIASIFFLIGITASVIKFMPSKSMHSDKKVLPQEKVSKNAKQITTTITPNTSQVNQKRTEMLKAGVMRNEEYQEEKAEREEGYKEETPEEALKRASLEKEIRTLSQAKEKEEKELSTLISSIDEAQQNSQLPPDELQKKQAEIKMIKLLLMRTYSDKLSSIDSSLQEKLQQYRAVVSEKSEAEEMNDSD